MKCVVCFGDTKVIDTYSMDRSVCRTRKCINCGRKFATKEYEVNESPYHSTGKRYSKRRLSNGRKSKDSE